MGKRKDLKVFITTSSSTCDECGEDLGRKAWITLDDDHKAFCLCCADLEHLEFLPAGDATLTRRSRRHSSLAAVVLKWSRARKRYERQGLLLEGAAIDRAEQECAADEDQRLAARERARQRRGELDEKYIASFAEAVTRQFPGCPRKSADAVASHACKKFSGRVGRSAAAKALDERAVWLAVVAHIRHVKTDYDQLLMRGIDRWTARHEVQPEVDAVLDRWRER